MKIDLAVWMHSPVSGDDEGLRQPCHSEKFGDDDCRCDEMVWGTPSGGGQQSLAFLRAFGPLEAINS